MATIVIGAQASGVGKTGVICALIAAMPERRWTAIKVTQCSHHGADAKRCNCELDGREFAISEELDAVAKTDSARYLAAGAVRSLWVRTLPGHLADAVPAIHEEITCAVDIILESNSALEFVEPDLYALIVSPRIADFKPSARRYLSRADAILIAALPAGELASAPAWMEQLEEGLARIPQFAISSAEFAPRAWLDFVREKAGI